MLNMYSAAKVKKLCEEHMLRPEKDRGQHFLIEESFAQKMVEAADVKKGDVVVEVGPGWGVLTEQLDKAGAHITAIEIEKKMADYIAENFPEATVINQDVLKFFGKEPREAYSVIANVPYQITGAIIRGFLEKTTRPPEQMVLMIQKEVAQRIMAKPGNMNLLALSVQYYGDPQKLFNVPMSAYWPQPKVESAVIHIKNIVRPSPEETCKLFALANRAFKQKRKMLTSTLAGTQLGADKMAVASTLKSHKIPENARPQELSVDQWRCLATRCLQV